MQVPMLARVVELVGDKVWETLEPALSLVLHLPILLMWEDLTRLPGWWNW